MSIRHRDDLGACRPLNRRSVDLAGPSGIAWDGCLLREDYLVACTRVAPPRARLWRRPSSLRACRPKTRAATPPVDVQEPATIKARQRRSGDQSGLSEGPEQDLSVDRFSAVLRLRRPCGGDTPRLGKWGTHPPPHCPDITSLFSIAYRLPQASKYSSQRACVQNIDCKWVSCKTSLLHPERDLALLILVLIIAI
jgi:hypothetical protein